MVQRGTVLYLSIFLFFFHSSVTIISSFLPVYFQDKELTGTQIGWLLAIGPFTSLFAQPFWGYMSDKYKTVKNVLLLCLVGLIVSSIVLFQMNSFASLIVLCGVFFSFMAPIGALGDSLAQKVSQLADTSFGRIRMWGSIGFAVTSIIGGWILFQIGIDRLLYVYLIFAFASLVIVLRVSDIESAAKPVSIRGAVKVVSQPRLLLFLFFILFLTIPHRANDSFIGLYIKELGGSESLIGAAWFVGVAVEAFVFLLSAYWMRWFSEITFIIIASGLYGLRWLLFSGADSAMEIIFYQAMHGVTFGIFYLCAFQFVTRLVPDEFRATGQLFFISVFFGLSGIIGSLGGGMIFDQSGGDSMYRILSYAAFAGCIGFITYDAYLRKKKNVPGGVLYKKGM
ncbi:MFS transporter [Mesobacillus foraminis]|uniref:MFS transporter n=1 Tax=Mesobacillus foraminis TaxID=279826 RepID=UPI001BE8A53C|nr:MFS transporter [Mesobacillus foraminis]MBT2755640.1 MFS transporter [Mesobacillus foraminis]